MAKEAKDKHFIKRPYYPGGNKAFGSFIKQNLKYPAEALEKKIEGTVVVKYDIDIKGNVIASKVISSLGYGCDEEAIRVIKLLKFTVPKEPRKLRIIFHKTTKIHFRLPKLKAKTINYKYTTTASKKNKVEEKKSSYHYTIKY